MWMAAAALAGLASTACSPLGLLNGVDRVGRGGVRRAAAGQSYGPNARHKLDVWTPADSAAAAANDAANKAAEAAAAAASATKK